MNGINGTIFKRERVKPFVICFMYIHNQKSLFQLFSHFCKSTALCLLFLFCSLHFLHWSWWYGRCWGSSDANAAKKARFRAATVDVVGGSSSSSKFINEWWVSVWWSFASNVLAWLLAFVSRMPSRPCVPSHPNEMDECQGRNQRIRGNIYVSKSQPFMVVSSSFFNKRPQKSVRKIMVATNDEEAP